MNFLKVIGQHTKGIGLAKAWTESGILGSNSTAQAMAGKSYNKGMCAHKLTFQAMWRILLPQFLSFLETFDTHLAELLRKHVCSKDLSETDELIKQLS